MMNLAFFAGTIGLLEVLLVVLLILVIFKARKLPELARSLRKSLDEFRKGKNEESKDNESAEEKKEDCRNSD